MSEKIKPKTKAELHEMLAEAVRNTQPQPVRTTQPEPVRDPQPAPKRNTQLAPKRETRPAPKRTAKIKEFAVNLRRQASQRGYGDMP
jgi:hypothetical protein